MTKYVCIHGHFYQPPRENPWLESIEYQDSAAPFHDWNARITAECYGPNATSRIFEPNGKIAGIMNNYSRISFNMGPTLLSWIEEHEPVIYDLILEGDRTSQEIYSGHGAALAQVYNHIIMPLANSRDKRTQVLWGIRDFQKRFGRDPEGMWLAETAVDMETLEILAEQGIDFTILAPRQAHRIRRLGEEDWHDVSGERIDPRRAYRCNLPSGRSIALFFYDGSISQDLAFGGLLHNGEEFARRLTAALDGDEDEPQLAHVATDGETFGHHHRQGEMALSYCLYHLERDHLARITIYPEFLELHPPEWEVQIHENSSWSCVHGVERWRADCGCCSGMRQGWHQQWRHPLRDAMDWLRDRLEAFFESEASLLFKDPWAARDDYIEVILDRSEDNVAAFLERHARRPFDSDAHQRALKLLESQRHALLMYTSCGWFFDEVSGIETTQVLRYCARAIQLLEQLGGGSLEREFTGLLAKAPSNIPDFENGREIYWRFVKPASVDLMRVAMHYSVAALFEGLGDMDTIYCFDVAMNHFDRFEAGRMRLALGRASIRSRLTWDAREYTFAVLHLGDHNLSGGIREFESNEFFDSMAGEIRAAFDRNDIPEVIRQIDRHFSGRIYSLWELFQDERRRIMTAISDDAQQSVENYHRRVFREHYPLMHAMSAMNMPLPEVFQNSVEYILNIDLRNLMRDDEIDEERFRSLVEEFEKLSVPLHREQLGFEASQTLAALSDRLSENPLDDEIIGRMKNLLDKYRRLEAPLNLWYCQNVVYEIGLEQFSIRRHLADRGDTASKDWADSFRALCDHLGVHVE